MQTILGSGGAVGTLLAAELKNYCQQVRLVARNPQKINADDELVKADLTDAVSVANAVKGSDVVYLCVGLTYKLSVWKSQWPVIMQNCIDACLLHNARLVFIDNVYMYAETAIGNMTEDALLDPPSEKGKVRLQIANMLLQAVEQHSLKALIARSADFYGPNVDSSMLKITVLDNFSKGKKAMWLANASKIHSFTYTPDIAKATALLGNTDEAYGQVWHLPTSNERLTGQDFIQIIAKGMKVDPRYYTMSKWMLGLLGLFMPTLKELVEMQYQNEQDYYFNSSKFQQRFNFTPTSYADGIRQVVAKIKK